MNATAVVESLSPVEKAQLHREALRAFSVIWRQSDRLFLYAIQRGEGGPIKLGVAKDPDSRKKTLQTGSPEKLIGLAAWKALPGDERELHKRFAEHRISGEWFHPAPELIEYVYAADLPWWWEGDELPEEIAT